MAEKLRFIEPSKSKAVLWFYWVGMCDLGQEGHHESFKYSNTVDLVECIMSIMSCVMKADLQGIRVKLGDFHATGCIRTRA